MDTPSGGYQKPSTRMRHGAVSMRISAARGATSAARASEACGNEEARRSPLVGSIAARARRAPLLTAASVGPELSRRSVLSPSRCLVF
ncbi:hypothetical protein MTO96_013057 [Rhipicephalus appendiculatus]